MLGKLIRQEFNTVSRLLFPLHLGLAAITIVGRFYVQFAMSNTEEAFALLNMMLVSFYVFAIMAVVIINYVYLIIIHPHRNLFGDEGYLMHTLPVKASAHIWAKTITVMIWCLIDAALVTLSIFCMVVNRDIIREFLTEFPTIWSSLMDGVVSLTGLTPPLGIPFLVISVIVESISSVLMVYMCLSIGHSFNSHKILASVGIYIGISVVISLISAIGSELNGYSLLSPSMSAVMLPSYYQYSLWSGIIVSLILGIVSFLVTNYFMTRRLNLE